jgi:hypothetical protein
VFSVLGDNIYFILALLSIVLLLIIHFNPPIDSDGGPMMAYNFLFFFPLLLASSLLAILTIIVSIFKWRQKSKRLITAFAILCSLPALAYLGLILFRISDNVLNSPSYEEMLEYEIVQEDLYVSTDTVDINETKKLYLIGMRWGDDFKNKRIYISLIPYDKETLKESDTYFCQGDGSFDVYYKTKQDSLIVYIPDRQPMYHWIDSEVIKQIPVKAIQMNQDQMDSLSTELNNSNLHYFEWIIEEEQFHF